jgi:hypothetical protein
MALFHRLSTGTKPGSPPTAVTGAKLAEHPKATWTGAPGGGSNAAPEGDDVDQIRHDDRYLEAMVASVPRAAGQDRRGDLALAREIHSAVDATNIFDRWREEDLFHLTREIERCRFRVVDAHCPINRRLRFDAVWSALGDVGRCIS